MVNLNISLPSALKDWIEGQAETGRYDNAIEYVRALIRDDQARSEKIAVMQQQVDEAFASGVGQQSLDEIWAVASRPAGRGD